MKVTESSSNYDNLDKMSTNELLNAINSEDRTVAESVERIIAAVERFIDACYDRMKNGGRLFYIGAGTSGRLGIVDASECPPTFGVDHGVVVGLIAGGDSAIRKAVENAEDDYDQAWIDLSKHNINENDTIIGIAASGSTPYVIGGLKKANKSGLLTGSITCNPNNPIEKESSYPMTVIVGPEFVTGSTRMKAGTAQKLVLNMISTSLMIKLGHVKGNQMVDMQLSNNKLVDRGAKMIQESLSINYNQAKALLKKYGSVRKAIDSYNK
ncbi:MAG: N-acetylmuramic acid 6-phosphate etherase [Crocinitomicaceae bacterium]|nr:N-acetylmuramic acid 6-phosphate etherase [Crocinitomicaceae bacterium]